MTETKPTPPVTGYRQLSEEEVSLMNDAKALEKELGALWQRYEAAGADPNELALAKYTLQTGFMWLVRSVAKPVDFYAKEE